MKLSVKALTFAAALIWGLGVLFVGLINFFWAPYGAGFLEVMSSVYPGYKAATGFGSVIIGALYALLDGAIAGALFAWLYNCFAPS